MTASEIFYLRTGQEGDSYIELAEQDVRVYLNYGQNEDVSRFASTVAQVAVLYYQRDAAVTAMTELATGVKAESFSEGSVSERKEYLTSADMSALYDTKVQAALHDIARYRRARVPEVGYADAGTV